MNKLKRNTSGFTLIELIVVMIIIGILVLLATPRFLNYIKDANVTALQVDAKVLGDASLYHSIRDGEEGNYPINKDTEKGLEEFISTYIDSDYQADLKEVIEYNLTESGYAKEDMAVMKVAKLNETEIADHVRNTKNKIGDYFIVTDGSLEGEVFYSRVLKNGRDASFAGLIGKPAPSKD